MTDTANLITARQMQQWAGDRPDLETWRDALSTLEHLIRAARWTQKREVRHAYMCDALAAATSRCTCGLDDLHELVAAIEDRS